MNSLTNKEVSNPGIPRVKFKKKDTYNCSNNFYSVELPTANSEDMILRSKGEF